MLYCIFVGGQIIMGTVVLSVIGNSVVSWAEDYLPGRRRLLVATMYVVILAALIGVGVMYIPRLTQEGAKLIARIQVKYVLLYSYHLVIKTQVYRSGWTLAFEGAICC
jgi:predicted PurR-regulated permease PerM